MSRTRRKFVMTLAGAVCLTPRAWAASAQVKSEANQSPAQPAPVALRGRVVCLTEEYQRLYQAVPDCDKRGHVYGLKTADGQLYAFLPTDMAAAISDDQRFRERELLVTARQFPASSFVEVIKLQSIRDGKRYDLFYFCEVCNIQSHKPGPCDCCQDPVIFHEEPAEPARN